MKSQSKVMETIRKKQEKAEAARRKQVEAERKGEKVEFEDIGGAKEPRTPSTIKPGKVEKVNLSHFKLKMKYGIVSVGHFLFLVQILIRYLY